MKRLRGHSIGVERGSVVLVADVDDSGEMWTGAGQRSRSVGVTFSAAFFGPPEVMVSLDMWDMDRGTNQRVDISATQVTETGFEILLRTWGDTRIARARAAWLAIGALPPEDGDDDWQLY